MFNFIKQQYKRKRNSKLNKKGYDAIGVSIGVAILIGLLYVGVGQFLFAWPRLVLDQDVQQFANTVRLDGYVTEEVYEQFVERIESRGYSESHVSSGLNVYVKDSPLASSDPKYKEGASLIQGPNNPSPGVVARGEGMIGIQLTLPANSGVYRRAVKNIGGDIDETTKQYNIARVVMSEAYRGVVTIHD